MNGAASNPTALCTLADIRNNLDLVASLRLHWPEYLMEVGEISLYLFFICSFATLLQHPASPVRHFVLSAIVRRALVRPSQARYELRHYASTSFNVRRAEGGRESPCRNKVYTGRLVSVVPKERV